MGAGRDISGSIRFLDCKPIKQPALQSLRSRSVGDTTDPFENDVGQDILSSAKSLRMLDTHVC